MNVFLINGTPIQLLLAEEAKFAFQIHDEDAVLAIRDIENDPYKLSIKTEQEVQAFSRWKKIYFIKQFRFSGFFGYVKNFRQYVTKAEAIIAASGPVKRIFFGNYGNEPMLHLANRYRAKGCEVYFLDEGNGTLHLYEKRERGLSLYEKSATALLKENLVRTVKRVFFGLRVGDVPGSITFFTEYPLKTTSRTNIHRHQFERLRSGISAWNSDNRIYFLGNAFIAFRHLTRNDYFSFLNFVRHYFSGKEILYVPHPRERDEDLNHIRENIFPEILQSEIAIEIYLAKNRILPAMVAGFTSTSLSRIYAMTGETVPVVAFRVPSTSLNSRRKVVENVYDYFAKEFASDKFRIVDINLPAHANT